MGEASDTVQRAGRGRVFDSIVDAVGDTPIVRLRKLPAFVSEILDRAVIDEIVRIDSATAIETSRAPARQEGIAGGISSGAAIAAALRIARRPEAVGKTILAIVPSLSERYLSTMLFEGV